MHFSLPKEAITTQKQPKAAGEKAKKAKVDVDLAKCNFCGICDVTCPYGAIKVTLNGKHELNLLAKDSFPQLVRDIKVDASQCPKECEECETACPLGLITVSKVGFDSKPVENVAALASSAKDRVQVSLAIKSEYCPTCRVCEFKCSPGTIKVKKAYDGVIAITQEKCPKAARTALTFAQSRARWCLKKTRKFTLTICSALTVAHAKTFVPPPKP